MREELIRFKAKKMSSNDNDKQVPNTQHCNEPQNEHKTNLPI